jgi:hypothetical protein
MAISAFVQMNLGPNHRSSASRAVLDRPNYETIACRAPYEACGTRHGAALPCKPLHPHSRRTARAAQANCVLAPRYPTRANSPIHPVADVLALETSLVGSSVPCRSLLGPPPLQSSNAGRQRRAVHKPPQISQQPLPHENIGERSVPSGSRHEAARYRYRLRSHAQLPRLPDYQNEPG